jgi:undecaprenyl phosphate N,N'-diacetylbacillosamine 1-phosphate transferase
MNNRADYRAIFRSENPKNLRNILRGIPHPAKAGKIHSRLDIQAAKIPGTTRRPSMMDKPPEKSTPPATFYRRTGKRLLDIFLSILALIVLFPFFLIMAIAIRLETPGPIFYFQDRLGLGGKIFSAVKFRTMTHAPRVPDHEILPADPAVTRVGAFLRRYKLDELTQLANVLKGEMSVVGPRPALPRQLAEYDETGRKRLLVKPGLSGLAQVNGNIYLTWPERWQFDARYVENCSLGLDLWIIGRTIAVMIVGEEKFLRTPTDKKV